MRTQQQTAQMSAQTLPREVVGFGEVAWQSICSAWGMQVIGDMTASIFSVVIPEGWALRHQVNNSLWSFLYDAQGRERAPRDAYVAVHPCETAPLRMVPATSGGFV